MLGWLERKFVSWGIRKQRRELENWLEMVRSMNSDELGMVVAVATHIRHGIEEMHQVNLLDPIITASANPGFIFNLHGLIKEFQARGERTEAAGVMVWLFTLRCGTALELRGIGRSLWKELQRGFPHVAGSAIQIIVQTGKVINIDGSDQIPVGLEPEPT